MDDDGRSGRGMAGGNMGKLTHLEAFLSDDGKRGRVWTCAVSCAYRKCGPYIEYFNKDDEEWMEALISAQRYASEVVTWADEPKTLTPREALRALEDGKCIGKDGIVYKIGQAGNFLSWYRTSRDTYAWKSLAISGLAGFRIVPEPSQPAESAHCERMVDAAIYAAKSVAEPQVEFPLTWSKVLDAVLDPDESFECELSPGRRYRDLSLKYSDDGLWDFLPDGYPNFNERSAKWRIVDGGK